MALADLGRAAAQAVREAEGFAKTFLKKAPPIPKPPTSPQMQPVPPKVGAPPGTGLATKPEQGEEEPDGSGVVTLAAAFKAVDDVLDNFAGLKDPDPIEKLKGIVNFFGELVGTGANSDDDQAKRIKEKILKAKLPQTKARSRGEKAGFRRIPLR